MRHRLLVVSHHGNWTFIRPVIAALERRPGIEVRTIELNNLHDDRIGPPRNHGTASRGEEARRARAALAWADTVFVEWCSANAAWVSREIAAQKRLIIRLHSSELNVLWPRQVAWEKVDTVIFVADHVRDRALAELDLARHPGLRIEVIGNLRDLARFDRPKRRGAGRRLGLIGWHRSLKQPHLAAGILAGLLEGDPDWELHLLGRPPDSGARVLTAEEKERRARETAYYAAFEALIGRPPLRGGVFFHDWTADVAEWLRDIGYILSCSTYEGTHEAVIEGMASGAVPVVRRWRGAAALYPGSLLFSEAEEAVARIRAVAGMGQQARARLRRETRRAARRRFDGPVVLPRLEAAVLGPDLGPAAAAVLQAGAP